MIDGNLREKILPPELTIKDFIKGEKQCNYEVYLLEFVNKSSFFRNKSNGENYIKPQSESNGECDCNSSIYELDFKLMASKTALQASSILSPQKSLLADEVWMTGASIK